MTKPRSLGSMLCSTTPRRGVARELIEELKRVTRERVCVSMWVLTDDDNAAATSLYRSTGGRPHGDHQLMFEYPLADG